jgi:outer membrane lipoprotein LolB
MLRLFILSLTLLMTACVPIWQAKSPLEQDGADVFWNTRFPQLVKLNNWEIQGRSVISQKRESWNAGLIWQEFNGTYQVKLQGPFAQGGAILKGQQGKAILIMDDGQILFSASPETLLKEALNMPLPIEALRDWVRGMPYAQQDYELIEFDHQGRVTSLLQQGWQIDYKRYIPFEHYSMPAKIFIKQGDRSLRIVISDWERTTIEQSMSWRIAK